MSSCSWPDNRVSPSRSGSGSPVAWRTLMLGLSPAERATVVAALRAYEEALGGQA